MYTSMYVSLDQFGTLCDTVLLSVCFGDFFHLDFSILICELYYSPWLLHHPLVKVLI